MEIRWLAEGICIILCSCSSVYFNENGSLDKISQFEHKRCLGSSFLTQSAVTAYHYQSNQIHQVLFGNTLVAARSTLFHSRKIHESVELSKSVLLRIIKLSKGRWKCNRLIKRCVTIWQLREKLNPRNNWYQATFNSE